MIEYIIENDEQVDIAKLQSTQLPLEFYKKSHEGLVILCHDVFIEVDGGILLVRRKNFPAKDIYWPIGGRVQRGVETERSLRNKVKDECGLLLDNITLLGCARTFFKTDPFNHGKGTDTFNLVYHAIGKGLLNLNSDHYSPIIFHQNEIGGNRYKGFNPYVKDGIRRVFKKAF